MSNSTSQAPAPHPVHVCNACLKIQPTENFVKDSSRVSGIRNICRTCWNSYHSKRRKEVSDAKRTRITHSPDGERRVVNFDEARRRALTQQRLDAPILAAMASISDSLHRLTAYTQQLAECIHAIQGTTAPPVPVPPDVMSFVEQRTADNAKALAEAETLHTQALEKFDAAQAKVAQDAALLAEAHQEAAARSSPSPSPEDLHPASASPEDLQKADDLQSASPRPDLPDDTQPPASMPAMAAPQPDAPTSPDASPQPPKPWEGVTSQVNVVDAHDEMPDWL